MHDSVGPYEEIAADWRSERAERQGRRELDRDDFDRLRSCGFLQMVVPAVDSHQVGDGWPRPATVTRPIADTLRALASGDPSSALVAAMHPAVVAFWLADQRGSASWSEQREAVAATAHSGCQWGTVTSEPGSGGDISKTKTAARAATGTDDTPLPGRRYVLTGDKHFGSGTGITSFMFTTAVPDDSGEPAAFVIDTRPLTAGDRVAGFSVTAEWDGMGMSATQSHAVHLDGCRAVRVEWPGDLASLAAAAGPMNLTLFTGVVLGILDEAIRAASDRLATGAESMRAYEQVEWSRAVTDHWLVAQAYSGMLAAVEGRELPVALAECLRGKVASAELAESCLRRISRVVGGGTFSRHSPFAAWYEDVRALGFLRPPWALAHDALFATSW